MWANRNRLTTLLNAIAILFKAPVTSRFAPRKSLPAAQRPIQRVRSKPMSLSSGRSVVGSIMANLSIAVEFSLRPRKRRKHTYRRAGGLVLSMESLEARRLLAGLPDLAGVDPRPGNTTYYFHLQESTPSWGDQVHLNYAIGNTGGDPPANESYTINVYLSQTQTINPGTAYLISPFSATVPGGGQTFGYTANFSLPQSNPFSGTGSMYIGMVINPGQVIQESNYPNDSNQGDGKDRFPITVSSPVAVVSDSQGSSTDHAINFGSVVDDGAGNALAIQTVSLSDSAARSLLTVGQNAIHLTNGTNFHIVGINSNKLSQAVNIASGTSLIAANSAETWTIQVAFDPAAVGSLTDTLQIQTGDPVNPTINVALSGAGTPVPNLVVATSGTSAVAQTVDFGNVVDNGAAGTATVTLTNSGSGPLTISQNGISLPSGPFSITSISSNTQGTINLSGGSKTIAAGNAETWTIALRFAPTTTGLVQTPLTILSDDPHSPSDYVSLLGTGQTAGQISLAGPTFSAGSYSQSFGSTLASGLAATAVTRTVAITNTGQTPLTINQNGIHLTTGAQFTIVSLVSNVQGAVNLSSGPVTIAPSGAETLTATVQFRPTANGPLSDTLTIGSSDPLSPTTTVALSGTGLDQPSLSLADADSGPALSFPATLNDGAGGHSTTRVLHVTNVGSQPLTVNQNGVLVLGGANFSVVSIVSSVSGAVNLAAGAATIAAKGTETWAVTVQFAPHATAALTDTLRILSNDPTQGTVSVALAGQGVAPAVTLASPAQALNVSAGAVYRLNWDSSYQSPTATISLYYDTDRNSTSGLTSITTGLPTTSTFYDWQIPTSLVGGAYTIYAVISDGNVSANSYAVGSLTIDPIHTDRLLSAPVTDQATYTLRYAYNGATINATLPLAIGANTLFHTTAGPGGPVTHEFHITRVPTLVDSSSVTYDPAGSVTSTTDSAGQVTNYSYDLLERVTSISYADGSSVAYSYDQNSNLVTMHDSTGWQLYAYDVLNRLTSVTNSPTNNASDPAALTIGYQYDADNRLTELDYPSGKHVLYGYDGASNLTKVTEKNAGQSDLITNYTYSATTGLLTKETRPDDTQTVYSYDTAGRLIDILHQRTSTSVLILEYHYSLDSSNRQTLAVMTTPSGSTANAYQYDSLNRLTQVTYSTDNGTIDPTDRVVQYTYDGNGNRLTMTTYATGLAAGATQTLTYAYGFENRLLSVTDQNGVVESQYSYDQRGNRVLNVTPTVTTRYAYDQRNLLIAVDDGTNHVTYSYDGAGRRVSQNLNGDETQFVVDPTSPDFQVVEERVDGGNVKATYTYGTDRIDSTISSDSSPTFYLGDALGSVGAIASSAGTDLGEYRYDAFGAVIASPSGVSNSFAFAGEDVDPVTGTIYLRARNLDTSTGQFLQKDATGFTDGPSRYVYTQDDPINYTDPLGEVRVDVAYRPLNNALLSSFSHGYLVVTDDVNNKTYVVEAGPSGFLAPIKAELYNAADHPDATTVKGLANPQASETLINVPGASAESILNTLQSFTNQVNASNKTYLGVFQNSNTFTNEARAAISAPSTATNPALYPEQGVIAPGFGSIVPQYNSASDIGGSIGDFDPGLIDQNKYIPFFPPGGGGGGAAAFDFTPGGVLINQAATLVGTNLKDISGGSYDPVSHQLVFLGNSSPAQVQNVNLNLFTTAIATVYGSTAPPSVTLDPPAKLLSQNFNNGDGDGVILSGKSTSIPIEYTPYTPTSADDMTLSFSVNGAPVSARINAQVLDGTNGSGTATAGGRYVVLLTLGNVTGLPAGLTVTQPTFPITINGTLTAGTITLVGGSGYTLTANAQGQTSVFYFSINNSSGAGVTVTNLQLKTDLQQRKFTGPLDGTQLGWIMEEADRVMKELAIGKDQLTGATYDSGNSLLPAGFENVLQRYVDVHASGSFNDRFWFTPDQETLQRYIDPTTGAATVNFSQSTVKLNTESLLLGQPQDPTAKAFADWFNANYQAMANISFPVHDPNDPTGNAVIQDKIFQDLEDAMKAVSLARFFHDNNIPLDTWWINSFTPTTATVPATIPTLSNSLTNGSLTVTMFGGVTIKTPNTYLPDAVAQSISNQVLAQRAAGTGDLAAQTWNVNGTPVGNLTAVAVSLAPVMQNTNVTLSATDISFASPGDDSLEFTRFYNSGFLGGQVLGIGWQPTQYNLQFQFPSIQDGFSLMRDGNGKNVPIFGAGGDTELRSGEIRLFDNSTGQEINFFSSLSTNYALDGQGNPIVSTTGLTANDVPTFTAGQFVDGSTLSQSSTDHSFTITRPNGSTLQFDHNGNLLKTTDKHGYAITYTYAGTQLIKESDSAGQSLTFSYDTHGRIQFVAGPDSSINPQRRVEYSYDGSGRLVSMTTESLQPGNMYTSQSTTQYQYNANNQLTAYVTPDGVTQLVTTPDQRGRSSQQKDSLGNMVNYSFTTNGTGSVQTTQAVDMGTMGINNPTAQGMNALKYFASGSTSVQQFDGTNRLNQSTDALGHTTAYSYTGSSLLPSSVTLPTPGSPSISIQRNSINLPTEINNPANVGANPIRIVYDPLNPTVPDQITDAKGVVTRYTYTSSWDVLTVTQAYGTPFAATTSYQYNSQHFLQSVTDPTLKVVAAYAYDSLGRVQTVTNGDGVTTTYAYDAVGRLSKVFDPRLTGTINYVQYNYNDNDQVTSIVTPTGTTTYAFDSTTHRLTTVTDPSSNVTQYGYDPASGALTSVTQVAAGGNVVTQQVYDRLGNLVLLISPDGNRTAFQHNALGRTTGMTEDDLTFPTATATTQVTSPTSLTVTANASKPILVAAVSYWLKTQPESSATTVSQRLNDATQFSFGLSGIDPTKQYDYRLTLTDPVGQSQTSSMFVTTIPQSITFGSLANHTYGDSSFIVSATTSSGLPVNFEIKSGPATFDPATNSVTITEAGTVVVEAFQPGDSTYDAAPVVDQSFDVSQAHLIVTANSASRSYGGAEPTFTANISGFVNTETLATSGVTGAASFTSSDTLTSHVGAYSINPALGTLAATNYDFTTFVPGTLTISPVSLVIKANDQTKPFGAALPALTAGYASFVNGDTTASLTIAPTLSTTANSSSPAGNYPITASGAADNDYTISYVPGTLTILAVSTAPTLTGAGFTSAMINESGVATLTATLSDTSSLDTFTLVIDWADGSAPQILNNLPSGSFTATHRYFDNIPSGPRSTFSVALTLTDSDGSAAPIATVTETVNNLPPTIGGFGFTPAAINENDVATLTATLTDPGSLDTFALVVNWADGGALQTFSNLAAGIFTATHRYVDNLPHSAVSNYSVNLTLTDDDGASASTATFVVTVNNLPPTLQGTGFVSPAINENSVASLTGTLSDPGPLDTFTLVINWADGSAPQTLSNLPSGSFAATHLYLDNFPRGQSSNTTILLALTDDDGGLANASAIETVNNIPPTVSAGGNQSPVSGSSTTLTGTFSDPGTLDTFVFLWHLMTDSNGQAVGDVTTQNLVFTPIVTGTYTFTFMVTDDDGGAGLDTAVVMSTGNSNGATMSNVNVTTPINENGVATLTGNINNAGADTLTLVVNWSDGIAPSTLNFAFTASAFSVTHRYLDNVPSGPSSTLTVHLSLSDQHANVSSLNRSVVVNDLPPTISSVGLLSGTINENGVATLTGTVSDPGALDTFTLSINWSDGVVQSLTNRPSGAFTITHQYLDNFPHGTTSTFSVSLTTTDDDGLSSSTATVAEVVNDLPPTLNGVGFVVATINENNVATLTATLSDPGTLDTFSLVVDWADGGAVQTFANLPSGAFTATHRYLDNVPRGALSNISVGLTLRDDDGIAAPATTANLTVKNVAPTTAAVGGTAVLGTPFTLTGSFTDPGALDTFSFLWHLVTDSNGQAVGDASTQNFTFTPASDGTYTFSFRVTDDDGGIGNNTVVVNATAVTPQVTKFDFDAGSSSANTFAGYSSVLGSTLYSSTSGYGWVTAPTGGFDRGGANLLLRDGNYGGAGTAGARTFQANIVNGSYLVNITMGDAGYARDSMQVKNADDGAVLLSNVTAAAGQFYEAVVPVTVSDGSLDLQFSDQGGDPYWVVNSLEIRPAATIIPVNFTSGLGPVTADGATIDTITGTAAVPDGTVLTISSTLGTMVTDSSSLYVGNQVVVNGGTFSFQIGRPTTGGTPTFTAAAFDGSAQGSTTNPAVLSYQTATTRRFDFNGPANVTAAGFIGVRGSNLYSASTGYGWNLAAGEFDRGAAAASTVDLYRDGNYGSAGPSGARTFEVQVTPSGIYGIRVYIGDAGYARDNIRVTAEGGASSSVTYVGVNQFAAVTLTGVDANHDGILTVTIQDLGGDPYWVINGVDVSAGGVGSLPGAAPLQVTQLGPGGATAGPLLTSQALAPIVQEAIARWQAAGIDSKAVDLLQGVKFEIANLDSVGDLGLATPGVVQIDDNGDGYGWFVDPTPKTDVEFATKVTTTELKAVVGSAAYGRMDLLTAVMHELGHELGLADIPITTNAHTLMTQSITTGLRRLPPAMTAAIVTPMNATLVQPITAATSASAGSSSVASDVVFASLASAVGNNSLANTAGTNINFARFQTPTIPLRVETNLPALQPTPTLTANISPISGSAPRKTASTFDAVYNLLGR
jgi:RHS repeat-associated protein